MSDPDVLPETRIVRLAVIVLITGVPASGKTVLSRVVAKKFGLPLFGKDRFKEMMYETICPDGDYAEQITRDFSQLLGRLSTGCLEIVLEECAAWGMDAVIESNFDSRLFSPRLTRIRERHPFYLVQARLTCKSDVLLSRFIQREENDRHPGHGGMRQMDERQFVQMQEEDEPLSMAGGNGELFTIDNTDFAAADYRPLFTAVAAALNPQNPN